MARANDTSQMKPVAPTAYRYAVVPPTDRLELVAEHNMRSERIRHELPKWPRVPGDGVPSVPCVCEECYKTFVTHSVSPSIIFRAATHDGMSQSVQSTPYPCRFESWR